MSATTALRCVCATHDDGSVTTFLCPVHADQDPCLTMSQVTGRRRTGTIRRGVCTSCGHGGQPMIPCAVFKCHHPATHGAIYRHEVNGTTAHPVYYYCDQHTEARRIDALNMWKVTANG